MLHPPPWCWVQELEIHPDICNKTPSAKSSAIYLEFAIHFLLVEIHPNLLNRILLGFMFSEIPWGNVQFLRSDIVFPPLFPLPRATSSLFRFVAAPVIILPSSLSIIRFGTLFQAGGTTSLFPLELLSYSCRPVVSLPSCLQSNGTSFSSLQRS